MKHRFASKIVILSVLLALMFSAVGVAPAQAAGIYTHSVFVERGIERLTAYGGYSELVDILNTYPAVVNYGAMFPDTTYAGIDDDWGEMLHDTGTLRSNYSKFLQFLADKGYTYNWDLQAGWYKEFLEDPAYTSAIPEFRAALMAQVLDHFNNNPRSAEDEKMIAFLFGLIAHQEADTPWHWNCDDPNWRGLECAASADLGLNEYQLEMTVKYFHGGNSADFSYVDTVYNTILAASDATGSRRPYCHSTCVAFPDDPIRTGNFNLSAFWAVPAVPPGWPWEWAGFNDWVYNHVPGGIYDGGALVVGAWMQTWDLLNNYTNIFYVKPVASGSGNCDSWANACALSYALSNSIPGQEIRVAAGTYKPTTSSDRTATFQLRSGVAIYGGFAGTETEREQRDPVTNLTILSGDIGATSDASDNSYHVVTGATGATLDGFNVTAGNANGNSCPGTGCGGGMQNLNASPTVTNVIFSGNAATHGGGMFNWASNVGLGVGVVNTHPIIMNVTFSGNSATANGGGMYNELSRPLITNVTLSSNTAGGDGGGMYNHTQLIGSDAVRHATFNGNSAFRGGGVYNYYGSVNYHNTIFWGNTATGDGAQVYEEGSALTIYNSVMQDGCPVNVDCLGIITEDPKLGTLGNYGGFTPTIPLLSGSSAIDAGDDTVSICDSDPADNFDQRGVTRPQGVQCDIGAFEAEFFILFLPLILR